MKKTKMFFASILMLLIIFSFSVFSPAASSPNVHEYYEYDAETGIERLISLPDSSSSNYARNSNEILEYDAYGNIVSRATPAWTPESDNRKVSEPTFSVKPMKSTNNPNDYQRIINTSTNPYNYVGYIHIYLGLSEDGRELWTYGTAFLEGPSLLVTAGVNCYSTEFGWTEDMLFYPGGYTNSAGTKYSPYGSAQRKGITIPTAWKNNANFNYNWGIVTLKTAIGNSTGWFGKRTSSSFVNTNVSMLGYPETTAVMGQGHTILYMYKSTGKVTSETSYVLTCTYNSYNRAAGAPIFDANYYVIGIASQSSNTNSRAVRMTSSLYDILQDKLSE